VELSVKLKQLALDYILNQQSVTCLGKNI